MQISLDLHNRDGQRASICAGAIAEEITNRLRLRYDMTRDVWVKADSPASPDESAA
jgi:hypothetical protein